jgi:hypothetical protein
MRTQVRTAAGLQTDKAASFKLSKSRDLKCCSLGSSRSPNTVSPWEIATRVRCWKSEILTGAIWTAAKGPEVGSPTLSSYLCLLTEWVALPAQISLHFSRKSHPSIYSGLKDPKQLRGQSSLRELARKASTTWPQLPSPEGSATTQAGYNRTLTKIC